MSVPDKRFLEALPEQTQKNSTEPIYFNMNLIFYMVLTDANILACVWA